MKAKKRNRKKSAGSASLKIILLSLIALARESRAQSVLMPPPNVDATPSAIRNFQTNEISYMRLPSEIDSGELEPFARLGPVNLRPHILYRALYAQGILSAPGQQQNTVIQEMSPGIFFEIGNHWTLDYTPTWRFYSDNHFRNTLDHDVLLTGGTTYEDWVLGLSQHYFLRSTPLIETGSQTDRELFGTTLTGLHRIDDKWSTDLSLEQTITSARYFVGYRKWSTLDWLDYQFLPRLDVGPGVGFGFVDEDAGTDMTYEEVRGRINWRATDKISLQLHAGFENRQFLATDRNLVSPLFGVAIHYLPVETTYLALHAERMVTPSYFQDQIEEVSTVGIDLDQRLVERLHLGLGVGYGNATYDASVPGVIPHMENNYYHFNARLNCEILRRGSIALTYDYLNNSSDQPGYSFSSNEIGIELGYRF